MIRFFQVTITMVGISILVFFLIPKKDIAIVNKSNSEHITVDATAYATEVADTISDSIECREFKARIMFHSNGNQNDLKTIGPIEQVKQKAISAGCSL